MTRLALLGIAAALVAGCPTAHSTVRSCAEAATAPDGTACEAFGTCPAETACGRNIVCSAGILLNRPSLTGCDGGSADSGSGDHDASAVDAGLDAGPCAPLPPPSGVGCHVSSECDPTRFEMCYAPGASTGCGPCVPAMRTCASDADCAPSDFCESYVDPCTHVGFCGTGTDPISTRCVPRCTPSSCGAGETCSTEGRCSAIPCTGGGYACPAHTHCGDLAGGDVHGCFRDPCAFDSDCGCGAACLSGSCYDTLGTCMSPAA